MSRSDWFGDGRWYMRVEHCRIHWRVWYAFTSIPCSAIRSEEDSLRSPLPRLEFARWPRIPSELRRNWASLNPLFFLIIGVSLSASGTNSSTDVSTWKLAIDFLVFRTNPSVWPMTLWLPHFGVGFGLDIVCSGDGRRCPETLAPNPRGYWLEEALAFIFVFINVVFWRLEVGGGEGDWCWRSLIARVDDLRRAILRSLGGGGRWIWFWSWSSSGGVSDDLGSWTGCGLNARSLAYPLVKRSHSILTWFLGLITLLVPSTSHWSKDLRLSFVSVYPVLSHLDYRLSEQQLGPPLLQVYPYLLMCGGPGSLQDKSSISVTRDSLSSI
jgi:hypothetical protein